MKILSESQKQLNGIFFNSGIKNSSFDARRRRSDNQDGFQIAEVDMKLRGPGDLQGTQQSGTPINLKLANLATDGDIIEVARDAAKSILKTDPNLDLPQNACLLNFFRNKKREKVNWSRIS